MQLEGEPPIMDNGLDDEYYQVLFESNYRLMTSLCQFQNIQRLKPLSIRMPKQ